MSVAQIFQVKFRVVNVGTNKGAKPSSPYLYTNEPRSALVQAASIHPKDLLTTLNNDITLLAGESIEILSASQLSGGTEGVGTVLT